MSEDAKKVIETVQKGKLPEIPKPNAPKKGLEDSQRALEKSTFGLQRLSEGIKDEGKK